MLALRDRGFARELLSWEWRPPLLIAEIAAARYFVRGDPHEAVAWAEIRDVGGARRVEVGSFPSVGEARAACDRHAAGLLSSDNCLDKLAGAPDVRIAPSRASSRRPAKPVRVQPALSDQAGDVTRLKPGREEIVSNKKSVAHNYCSDQVGDKKDVTNMKRRPWGTSPACLQRRARREPGDHADLDAALAAFAHVLGEE